MSSPPPRSQGRARGWAGAPPTHGNGPTGQPCSSPAGLGSPSLPVGATSGTFGKRRHLGHRWNVWGWPGSRPALAPQKQVSTLPKTGAQAGACSPRLPARAPTLGSARLPATETSSLTCTEMGSSLHHKLTVNPVPYNTSGFHHLTMAELEVLFPPSFLVASPRAWDVSPFNCKLQKRMKELARKHVIQP